MQVSVETTSGLERRLTITIPADKIQTEVDQRIKELAPKVQLDGFRKGKVPSKVVRQRYGEGVRQEVLGEMMSSSFQEAVTQEELRPAGQPEVDAKEAAKDKDFVFTATFEVYPEIKLNNLDGVEILRPVTEINDQDVDQMIETLRTQQASWEDADRAAVEGDQVNIDYDGFKGEEAFEGGKGEGQDLELGSKSMIPGFEDGIVGLTAGDEKELNLTFPEDYHAEELKGQDVVFKVKVNSVKERKLPEIDEEFISKFGIEGSDLETLKVEVKKNMARELKAALKNRVKQQVMDAVLEQNTIEVPGALINQEVNTMRQQMLQQFGGSLDPEKLDLNSLLPAEMFSEQATRRVSLGLLLSQVVEDKEVKADADDVRAAVDELASAYEKAEEVVDYYYSNQQQLAQVEAMVMEDSVVDLLVADANVVDEPLSYEDLMAKVAAAQQQS